MINYKVVALVESQSWFTTSIGFVVDTSSAGRLNQLIAGHHLGISGNLVPGPACPNSPKRLYLESESHAEKMWTKKTSVWGDEHLAIAEPPLIKRCWEIPIQNGALWENHRCIMENISSLLLEIDMYKTYINHLSTYTHGFFNHLSTYIDDLKYDVHPNSQK